MEQDSKKQFWSGHAPMIISTIIIGGINIFSWYASKNLDPQIVWIGFILVWFNLLLSWLTFARQPYISYIFVSSSFVIEAMVLINNFFVSTRIL